MRNMHTDSLSRPSASKSVTGRGVAVQAQRDGILSGVQRYMCKRFGHLKYDCPNNKNSKPSSKMKGGGEPKWSSLHKTTGHSDSECVTQKNKTTAGIAASITANGSANFANVYSPHLSIYSSAQPNLLSGSYSGRFSFTAIDEETEAPVL